MKSSDAEEVMQMAGDLPDWAEDTPPVNQDKHEDDDYSPDVEPQDEIPDMTDTHAVQAGIDTPEADLNFKKLSEAIQTIHDYERSVEQTRIVINGLHDQAEEDHARALTDVENMTAVITLAHRYIKHDMPKVIDDYFKSKGDIVFDMSVDYFKDQIAGAFSSAVAELDSNIQKSAVAAEAVRVMLWQQFLKQTVIAGIVAAITAPLSIFIFRAFFK